MTKNPPELLRTPKLLVKFDPIIEEIMRNSFTEYIQKDNSEIPEKINTINLVHFLLTNLLKEDQNLFTKCRTDSNAKPVVPYSNNLTKRKQSQYIFLGKLIGISIRNSIPINIPFPSLVWKLIVFEKPNFEDLKEVDHSLFLFLEKITQNSKSQFEQLIKDHESNFTIDSFGKSNRIELFPGGSMTRLKFEITKEYSNLCQNFRMNEFFPQIHLIQEGIKQIIPNFHIFHLFTWQEFKKLISRKVK
ncbi:e3 ubiquitin-protein ligase hectd3 [Anaeramoeba ignava]|uniref:E3 ubiquitin-protein ligase hectd3 n=1 Tax=Anaeramoeba ignava TaxID=1746090 RepID=A0A9Q0LI92_ANAIG|nr:e3 ubiquitin-protein ligase hectd3 [Anaeramoeba ignava]